MLKARKLSAWEYVLGRYTVQRIPEAIPSDEEQWAVTDRDGHVYEKARTKAACLRRATAMTEDELDSLSR